MSKTLKDAQDFVERLSKQDTGLGGFLQMYPFAKQSLAYDVFQFTSPVEWLRELEALSNQEKVRSQEGDDAKG